MPSAPKWLSDTLVKLMGSKMPILKIKQVEDINPQLRKITFEGNLSEMEFQPGFAVMIRVNDTEMRNYTVYPSEKGNNLFETIVHLHGDAAGSNLMKNLETGDELRMSNPRGHKYYDETVKKQVIFGDETSLALAKSYIDIFKKNGHVYQFYFELDEENWDAPANLGLDHVMIFSKKDTFRNPEKIAQLPLFKDNTWTDANYILTGNVTSMQNFKKVLKSKEITGRIFIKGHWLEGKKGL